MTSSYYNLFESSAIPEMDPLGIVSKDATSQAHHVELVFQFELALFLENLHAQRPLCSAKARVLLVLIEYSIGFQNVQLRSRGGNS